MASRSPCRYSLSTRLLMLGLLFVLGGCGLVLTPVASLDRFEKKGAVNEKREFDDAFVQSIANDFALMALFAQVAYRQDLRRRGDGVDACSYTESAQEDGYGMPPSAEGSGRWMRWKGKHACTDDVRIGLFYETYVFVNADNKPQEAVIAFRGTENYGGQFLADWGTNLSAFFGIEPDQYAVAQDKLPELIEGLTSNNPAIRIYAVGHSLGGGLAQQAGYLSPKISKVVTFNTSPVSNWTRLRLRKQVQNNYPLIYRIYHGGEILEKVRFITTSFTSTRFNRYDLGLQFDRRRLVGGHSLSIVTCTLAEIVSNDHKAGGDAQHHYGRDYARRIADGGDDFCAPVAPGRSALRETLH